MTTFVEKLNAANLPVRFADENGNVVIGTMTSAQEETYNDIILEHFMPSVWADVQQIRSNWDLVKSEYQNMITRLETIETTVSLPFTQNGFNQLVNAVKDEATYIKRIMKVFRRIAT